MFFLARLFSIYNLRNEEPLSMLRVIGVGVTLAIESSKVFQELKYHFKIPLREPDKVTQGAYISAYVENL